MDAQPQDGAERCGATTAAGRPCRYPAVMGSDPPRCELHGQIWPDGGALPASAACYDHYLRTRFTPQALARLDDSAIDQELKVARALVGEVLEQLVEIEQPGDARKVFVPIALRCLKLVFDMAKYQEMRGEGRDWRPVLERLAEELDSEL
jgi:hypothetical protein